MSWKALSWATEARCGSPVVKLVLILLANKADEDFSCYPSIRTLMDESEAARSTVIRALGTLEQDGFLTRRAQYHRSGAQRSTRYYLNHPDAVLPDEAGGVTDGPSRLAQTPPGSSERRGPSHSRTRGVAQRHPPRVAQRDPLNPPCEPPSDPAPSSPADDVLNGLPAPWTVGRADRAQLSPAITKALGDGWEVEDLILFLSRNPQGVRFPARVLTSRLADLPAPPRTLTGPSPVALLPWCGECEDERSRTITIYRENGTEAATFCPKCSPQSARSAG
ncbi:helix-turn-helix domain-containing protein [Gordonia sihwensis]|uniref:helix-turn-helix domain-containing protein n=1 Tax=Gordonia sihwensis TaxID=173559 RepID=UPI003D96115B